MRFFAGLTEKEAAEVLGISVATLKRDGDFARAVAGYVYSANWAICSGGTRTR